MEKIIDVLNQLDFSNILWQIMTPLIFSMADILTGLIQAIINKNLDSQKMRMGLLHKTLLIIIILLGFTLDFTFNLNFVSRAICIFVIAMETVSIAENLKKAGIPIGGIANVIKTKSDNTVNDNLNYLINKFDEETTKEEGDEGNDKSYRN